MKKVLIIEEENSARNAIKKIIESMEFSVVECENDETAQQLFRKRSDFDLIICNDKSSKLITELKKQARFSNIPVITMSSHAGVKHIAALLEQGASAFINKPTLEADLVEYVMRYIS